MYVRSLSDLKKKSIPVKKFKIKLYFVFKKNYEILKRKSLYVLPSLMTCIVGWDMGPVV